MHTIAVSSVLRRVRRRRMILLSLAAALAVAISAGIAVTVAGARPLGAPFVPGVDDGVIAEGSSASIDDGQLPAIARLAPAVRDAFGRAAQSAAVEGIALDITSGWRSEQYQRWLFDDAVEVYGSREVAGQFVASPEASRHVTGEAVDIGSLDAQLWLSEHGAAFGICQTYANERWHFEVATTEGSLCPPMRTDAAG
jgi:zinc D-Ala-D-Ala carboxypeptidase